MIETLNGIKETINFKCSTYCHIYDNSEYEDYPQHWHLGIEIIVPVENYYDVFIESEHYRVNEQDIIIINSGVLHSIKAPLQGKRYIIQFDLSPLYHFPEFETALFLLPNILHLTSCNKLHNEILSILYDIIDEYNSNNILRDSSIHCKLLNILIIVCRTDIANRINFSNNTISKQQEYIEKLVLACNYISKHYQEDIYLDDIADLVGFSKFHFSRLFKEFTNMTFYNYLINHRIKRAEIMLLSSNLKVLDIALNCGFNSISTFNRVFKDINKCTPNDFRKSKKDKIDLLNN